MATTTPNYGWPVPTSTDLVKDGAVAIESLGDAADATMATMVPKSIVDAKGDIIAATAADTVSRLAVGANNTVLTADSTAATGLKWATASSTSGPAFFAYRSGNQSITTGTGTKVAFNAESFDTDNCFDSTTNYRFTPTKSGYYQMNSSIECAGATVTRTVLMFFKNGSEYQRFVDYSSTASNLFSGSTLAYFNGSSDYAEVYVQVNGTSLTVNGAVNATTFTGVWIRS
jgi:hypothetical protein